MFRDLGNRGLCKEQLLIYLAWKHLFEAKPSAVTIKNNKSMNLLFLLPFSELN